MLIKASLIGNLPIITINDGKSENKVKDVIYDGQSNLVKALLVDDKGWFKGAKILLLTDIISLGQDAVTIEDDDCFTTSDDQNDANIAVIVNDHNFLTKNKVITENGTDLGRVTDIYFNFPSGEVVDIEVSKGFLQNLGTGRRMIKLEDVITVGTDNLIVKDVTIDDFEAVGDEVGGDVVVNNTRDNISTFASNAVAKTQELADAAKNKYDEIVQSDQVKDAISKTQDVVNNVKDSVVNTYQETKHNIESGKAEKELKEGIQEGKENVATKVGVINGIAKEHLSETFNKVEDMTHANEAGADLTADNKADLTANVDSAKRGIEHLIHDTKASIGASKDQIKDDLKTLDEVNKNNHQDETEEDHFFVNEHISKPKNN